MKKKDQEAIAKLYTEGYTDNIGRPTGEADESDSRLINSYEREKAKLLKRIQLAQKEIHHLDAAINKLKEQFPGQLDNLEYDPDHITDPEFI